jgi:alanine racemase
MESGLTRAWVDVDLGALQRNAVAIAARAGVPILPMVKADAYGLGAVAVARALESVDPWGFGVATVDEGAELRDAGIERRIVVFTPLDGSDLGEARRRDLTPALSRAESIAAWKRLGGGPWQLAIDTGMSRSGIRWDALPSLHATIAEFPPEGAFTHFHSADRNDGSVDVQESRFREAVDALPERPPLLHTENGAAIEHRGRSPWSHARPGIFLYGVGCGGAIAPEPVVHLRARVADLRTVRDGETVSYLASYRAVGPRTIATLAIGYADGLRRSLSNRGSAIVRGRMVPIAGLITMDMTMIDVTGVPCVIGDTVTLIGRDGPGLLDVGGVAAVADLSPYELLTGLRCRVHRRYLEDVA